MGDARRPEFLARDEEMARDLYLLEVGSTQQLPRLEQLRHFVCLLIWDTTSRSVEEISSVIEPLLDDGCLYFNTAGPDCERVHDIIDGTVVGDGSGEGPYGEHFVMTSWHDGEPLRDTLYFFLRNSWFAEPDQGSGAKTPECRAGIAILIGQSSALAANVREALRGPKQFASDYLADDDDE